MIVLKILLWIVLAILGIILLFLIIPISAEVAYIDKKFTYKIIYGFVNLHDSEKSGIASKFINRFVSKKKNNDIENVEDNIEEVLMPEPDEIYDNAWDETDDIIEDAHEDTEVTETESIEEISDDTENNSEESDESEESKKEDSEGKIDRFLDKIDKYEGKIEILLDMLRSADRPLIHLCKGFRFSRIYIDFMIAGEDAYKCALNYGRISGAVYNLLGWFSTICTTGFETVDIFPDFKAKESRWDISVRFSFKFITPIVAGIYFLITYMFRFFIPQKWQERKLKKSRKSKK